MVTNLNALKKLGKLQDEQKHFNQELAKKAFKIFDTMPEVEKIIRDVDNCERGEYFIDEDNMLAYRVEVPKELRDLPFINDYLTKDFGWMTGKDHKDLWFTQCCGDFIAINRSHGAREAFVFESSSGKTIIQNNESWMEDEYIAAVIEKHQQEKGEFGDVIEIHPHYGTYLRHFHTLRHLGQTEQAKEEIQRIIDKYENRLRLVEEA
jgi:hypothetical protein